MTVSKIDDRGNEKQHAGPERKDAYHGLVEGYKAFDYSTNGFPEGCNESKDEHNENGGHHKDFHEGYNERKDGHHGFKDVCHEHKDGYPENHDGRNGFKDPK